MGPQRGRIYLQNGRQRKETRTHTDLLYGRHYTNMQIKRIINIDGMTYGERELSQLIRRKMLTQTVKDKKRYTRKEKHRSKYEDS